MTPDPSSILIRPATSLDSVALAALSTQLGYPVTSAQVARRLEKIGQNQDHAVFVAELQGQVAGWVEVIARTILIQETTAEIEGLVVDEALRGQGVGKALMAGVEAWACHQGCSRLFVRSNVIREAAHRFYENLGFQVLKTQKAFQKAL